MKHAVLITGATHGLGRALALKFSTEGHFVILHGRDKEAIGELTMEIQETGSTAVLGDLQHTDTIDRLVAAAQLHELGILINNAGMYLTGGFEEFLPAEMRELVEVNLMAPILLTHRIYGVMRALSGGMIVNINSLAVSRPACGETVYAASKGGLRAFGEALSQEATANHVHVLNIALGAMDTAMQIGRTDLDKCIHTEEAAEVIYQLAQQRKTLRVSEVEIRRARY